VLNIINMSVLDSVAKIFAKYNIKLEEEDKKDMKLAEGTLADGTMIYSTAESWAVGVDVAVKNEDGELVAVPDGEYELDNGIMIVVKEGLLESIVEPTAEEVEEETAAGEEKKDEELAAIKQELEDMRSAFNTLKASLSADIKAKEAEINALKLAQAKRPAKAPQPKAEKVELSKLNPRERAFAIFNQF
jgi:hypothetical protein